MKKKSLHREQINARKSKKDYTQIKDLKKPYTDYIPIKDLKNPTQTTHK